MNDKTPSFIPLPPCVNAPRGYQSDHFIFRIAAGRTYISTVQLFTSAAAGNISTLHQGHVSLHHGAFNRINRCVCNVRFVRSICVIFSRPLFGGSSVSVCSFPKQTKNLFIVPLLS